MHSNPKSERGTGDPMAEPRPITEDVPGTMADIMSKGTKRLVELHKSALDMTVRQNLDVFNAFDRIFKPARYLPGMMFYELGVRSFENLVKAEKEVLDLVAQQTEAMLRYEHGPGDSAEQVTKNAQTAFRDSVDRVTAAHKTVLDFAAEQNKTVFETAKRQLGGNETATAAAESMQHSFDALITTQKKMLDSAVAPVKAAAAKA